MLHFLTALVLLASLDVQARSSLPQGAQFTCQTEIQSTSMSFSTRPETKGFRLRVTHHNGPEWMPIYKGVIAMNNLETLKERGRKLNQMGQQYSFEFQEKDCELIEGHEINCYLKGPIQIGELNLQSVTLHNYSSNTRILGFDFKTEIVSLALTIDNVTVYQTMDYNTQDCLFQGF